MLTPGQYNQKRGTLLPHELEVMIAATELDGDDILGHTVEYWLHDMSNWHTVDWEFAARAVAVWQSTVGLTDDGMFGPVSERRYRQLYEQDHEPSALAAKTLEVAIELLGQGEEHQNNAGQFLHMLRTFPFGDDYERPIGNWCEFLMNYCIREAAHRLNLAVPFETMFHDRRRNRKMPIGSAKAFGYRAATAGKRIANWKDLRVGDFVIWDRGARGSRAGHIAIVELVDSDGVQVIEGNYGPFPAKVQRRVASHRRFEFGARVL